MGVKVVRKTPKGWGRVAELRTFLWMGEIRVDSHIPLSSLRYEALVAHEMKHWEQYKKSYWLHPLRYKMSKRYRFQVEVEAYIVQFKVMKGVPELLNEYASYLVRDYGLNITHQIAKDALLKELGSWKTT